MDRSIIVLALQNYIKNTVDIKDCVSIIYAYANSVNNKITEEMTWDFLFNIDNTTMISCYIEALEYYSKEFNIVKVLKDNKIITVF